MRCLILIYLVAFSPHRITSPFYRWNDCSTGTWFGAPGVLLQSFQEFFFPFANCSQPWIVLWASRGRLLMRDHFFTFFAQGTWWKRRWCCSENILSLSVSHSEEQRKHLCFCWAQWMWLEKFFFSAFFWITVTIPGNGSPRRALRLTFYMYLWHEDLSTIDGWLLGVTLATGVR